MASDCFWLLLVAERCFVQFYKTRAALPFFNFSHEAVQSGYRERREVLGDPALAIPRSRASTWPRSWKRFLIDHMYGRGEVMLYPAAPADPHTRHATYSLSTTYMERGDHSGTDGKVEDNEHDALRPNATLDPRKTVPLLRREHAPLARRAFERLPSFGTLPVLSLFHQRVTDLAKLVTAGRAFVQSRAAYSAARATRSTALRTDAFEWDPRPATQHPASRAPSSVEYEQLARLWLCEADDGC